MYWAAIFSKSVMSRAPCHPAAPWLGCRPGQPCRRPCSPSMTSEVMVSRLAEPYREVMTTTSPPVGVLLRQWRERRRLSQLDLALSANVSTRHLSHVETGKAKPSSSMIERLAEH